MTIDIADLPLDSDTECTFSELSLVIQDKINLHRRHQEEPKLCVVLRKPIRYADELQWEFCVQVLTVHRVIKVVGDIYKGKEVFHSHGTNTSMVLSNFVGFTEKEEYNSPPISIYSLVLSTHSGSMKFYFHSNELLKKFANTILVLSKDY